MSQEYIYGVARVRAREVSLLGKNDLEQLMDCPAKKSACGYSGIKAGQCGHHHCRRDPLR